MIEKPQSGNTYINLPHLENHPQEQHEFLEQLDAVQRNIHPLDEIRNGARVDGLMWKGNPNAPIVQRIGFFIFGFVFELSSMALFLIFSKDNLWIGCAIALCFGLVGLRLIYNAFRGLGHKKK